jgi:hypothetical protein
MAELELLQAKVNQKVNVVIPRGRGRTGIDQVLLIVDFF